jgi:hypothetical protein
MSQSNTLITASTIGVQSFMVITSNYSNCCDAPQRGDIVGYNQSNSFTYVRTDGHGCDGRQGQFEVGVFFVKPLGGQQFFRIQLDFDSDGNIELSNTTPNPSPPGIISVQVFQIVNGPDTGKYQMQINSAPA